MDIKKYKKHLGLFKKWIDKLSPPLSVGGLYITDTSLIYLKINGKKFDKVFLRLPPGVIEGGIIKDKAKFNFYLQEFRGKILTKKKDKVFVVLSLQPGIAYIQTVPVPKTADSNQSESILLNLRMTSPINANNAYMGWQSIETSNSDDLKEDVLGVFVPRDIVDGIDEALQQVGIYITVVEFSSLSLARAISHKKILEAHEPYMMVRVGVDGVGFAVVRDGMPFFHTFHSWKDVAKDKKTVLNDDFKTLLRDEIHHILNFYASRWGDKPIGNLIVISNSLFDDINLVAKEDFSSLKLQVLDDSTLNVVMGSAIRGMNASNLGNGIDLLNFSESGALSREIMIQFTLIWRNLYISVLGFFLIVFALLDILIVVAGGNVFRNTIDTPSDINIDEFNEIKAEVIEFNTLVEDTERILNNKQSISALLVRLDEIAGADIDITSVAYTSLDQPIPINGNAVSGDAAFLFEKRLSAVPQFTDVDLPITSINSTGDVTTFRLSFKVTSLDL